MRGEGDPRPTRGDGVGTGKTSLPRQSSRSPDTGLLLVSRLVGEVSRSRFCSLRECVAHDGYVVLPVPTSANQWLTERPPAFLLHGSAPAIRDDGPDEARGRRLRLFRLSSSAEEMEDRRPPSGGPHWPAKGVPISNRPLRASRTDTRFTQLRGG